MTQYAEIRRQPPGARLATYDRKAPIPADAIVVAADTHWSVPDDIWIERFPEHLKDRAPRVWRDEGFWNISVNGKSILPGHPFQKLMALQESRPGVSDMAARRKDLADEGIDKEIVFPNAVIALFNHPDIEVRECIFRIYNEYMAELQKQAPGHFYGVGVPNYWDSSKSRSSIEEIKALGLKTFMLPLLPKNDVDGDPVHYAGDKLEVLWAAAEDSGLPVSFHIGEVAIPGARNSNPIGTLQNLAPFRKVFGELVFGGIIDRHPGLRIVFAEGGINWVAAVLQDAQAVRANAHTIWDGEQQHDIPYYWHNHMYATFMSDPLGWRVIDLVGADRLMWSSDYPHAESTLGYSQDAVREVFDAVPEAEARMIIGGTAMRVFDL
jgi:predicted TIM-barrel fold metal-dependent hydrolase